MRQIRAWLRGRPRPWAIDVFGGAGGLAWGLHEAGFSVVVGVDNDQDSVLTHSANLRSIGLVADLAEPHDVARRLKAWGLSGVDLLAGGPPCQPFSLAGAAKLRSLIRNGTREEEDPRAELWRAFVELASLLKPRAVLIENVPDFLAWKRGRALTELLEALRARGYRTTARLLSAAEHGVPQYRRRLFVIGFRDDHDFSWPRRLRRRFTIRDAISDLPVVGGNQRKDELRFAGPRTSLQRSLRRGTPRSGSGLIRDHITRAVRADDAKAFRRLSDGGASYSGLPKRLRRYRADIFKDKYHRLEWDEPSRTLTAHLAKDAYWYIHPSQTRTISLREAARLQTFPDRFRFAGHFTSQLRQIGNAVPPRLAERVGRSIREALRVKATRKRKPPDLRASLLRWHRKNRRALPWRRERNAWRLLIAEMCLRRTRADQVAGLYETIRRVAPTPAAVVRNAKAVRRALVPLGLHWRTRTIIDMARLMVRKRLRSVPTNYEQLRALPGVGDYVASAVRCFAYGRPTVLLDSNIRRIVRRMVGDPRLGDAGLRLELYRLAGRDGPDQKFNYAMLDLGHLVCRPRTPLCGDCPLRPACIFGSKKVAAPPSI